MRVRCTFNKYGDLPVTSALYDPGDDDVPLRVQIGREYVVYAVYGTEQEILYAILPEDHYDSPRWYPSVLFEVVDGRVAKCWRYTALSKGKQRLTRFILAFPEWAAERRFFSQLVDGAPRHRALWRHYKPEIELETAAPPGPGPVLTDLEAASPAPGELWLPAQGRKATEPLLPTVLDEIQGKLEVGDEALDAGEYATALARYREAAALLPEPRLGHDISYAVHAALGDGYFFAEDFQQAAAALRDALKAADGLADPVVHLRLGQAYFEMGDLDRAFDSLMYAYALDGRNVFQGEDGKYLAFLAARTTL